MNRVKDQMRNMGSDVKYVRVGVRCEMPRARDQMRNMYRLGSDVNY